MNQHSIPSNKIYDVCVVGGGPAGVACAITVALKGYDVIIVDKKSRTKIGDKTCGDAIDRAALERVKDGIGIDYPEGKEVSDYISKMSIAANDIDLKLTLDAAGYVLDRHNYGQRLLSYAEELGVEIIDRAPVRDVLIGKNNRISYVNGVVYYKNGKKKEIRAKFTIDASGAYASVRKELPKELLTGGIRKELNPEELWPTYREIIKLREDVPTHRWPEEIVLMYDQDYPPPGYFWVFTKGDNMLNVGIGWEKTQELGKLKQKYQTELHKYYTDDQYTVLKRGGGQIPFRPPFDNLVFNGGALVGDAACMVHPVTAEGHGPALDTSMHLGFALIDALQGENRSYTALWSYNVAVSNHYARKHMEAYLLKEFLRDVGADGLQYLIEKNIFREEELNLIFSGGNLELSLIEKLKRVSKLLFKPTLLLKLRKVLSLSNIVKKVYNSYPTNPNELTAWRNERNKLLSVDF